MIYVGHDIFDKLPTKSKKFLALLFTILVIAGVMITALVVQPVGWPLSATMLAGMLTIGFLGVGYILSTASLDRYIQMAQITKGQTNDTKAAEE